MLQTHETAHLGTDPMPDLSAVTALVAEDDPDFRAFIVNELRRAGCHTTALRDGYQFADFIAAAELRGRRPDIIITDVRMPGFDGLSLVGAIREANWTTPVIIMTAFASDHVDRFASRFDAVAVLSKPFDVADLRRIVAAVAGLPFTAGGSQEPT
jgi:CheY-like chemotaxis protein